MAHTQTMIRRFLPHRQAADLAYGRGLQVPIERVLPAIRPSERELLTAPVLSYQNTDASNVIIDFVLSQIQDG